MKQTYPTLDILLRWVVALAVFVYFGAVTQSFLAKSTSAKKP